jgi:putative membrane protein insertion efficiency factor
MIGRALLEIVRFYSRAISPALPPRCRFYPSCSAYAAEAIERHGAGRGSWLTLRRIVKCAPWHPGGVDLVPGADRPGTDGHDHSSSSAVPSTQVDRNRRPSPAAPPASRRVNEESSVA